MCKQVLSDDPLAVLVNSYTAGLSPAVMSYILNSTIVKDFGGEAVADEIGLRVSENGLILPCGSTAIWKK
jgi:23S rRNA (cytosine1962-C5)-methyltransferase